ncbi:MAG: GDSL-type esterase/lipase family protein [Kiritimatiellae bacterium]|nr:GDSL-type esterase/lipase family protein [Kiritimatiellia bacterium]
MSTKPLACGVARKSKMRIILYILDLAFLAALIIVLAAWLMTPLTLSLGPIHLVIPWSAALILVPPVILVLRVVIHRYFPGNGIWEYSAFRKVSLALAATFLFFFGVEQCLKLAGYEAHVPPIVIVGQKESDTQSDGLYLEDSLLLFRFRPGAEFNGRTVNRMGFLDREVDPAKKPGTMRVICMGDSVTGQGIPPYSGHLNAKLAAAPPGAGTWESFNMAVHGYTSVQGLRLFELQAVNLKPDIVAIMYGWNDHWLSPLPDSNRMVREVSPGRAILYRILRMKRFGQLLLSLSSQRSLVQKKNASGVRVPLQEYEQTLMRFVAEVRAVGAIPILMTSPRAAKLSRALVHRKLTSSVEEAIRAHDEYNDIVRKVAADTNTPLIDLARKLSGDQYAGLFSGDGIHFNSSSGIVLMAEEVHQKIGELAKAP